ncbi:Fe-S cluster assembly ATPase SufC [Planctomycetota bacterium]
MIKIDNLHAKVEDDKEILKGVNLDIKPGEVHAIMGPNGSGKSTLSKVLAGHPDYEVTNGAVLFDIEGEQENLLDMEPDERAREGVFLAFQYPVEIPGVSNSVFLRACYNEISRQRGLPPLDPFDFVEYLRERLELLDMDESFLQRAVNVDFSGGEKKRNEILQMAVLQPRLAILDETDSGLDVDSLRLVAHGVNTLRSKDNGILLITHYQRLLDYIKPDIVHVMVDGRITKSGGPELALAVEDKGYAWVA